MHLDWHACHYVKCELDKIFGYDNFVNEIVWCYSGGGQSKFFFPRKHGNVFLYQKSTKRKYKFNADAVRVPYESEYQGTSFKSEGTRARGNEATPRKSQKNF